MNNQPRPGLARVDRLENLVKRHHHKIDFVRR